ncbi:DUF6896 domain-containing protein [Hymenobacter puniceus]|uniref:DUF6896 domain-containing protein n=1 Tax=Hymenobacter sp. BT190 TaxID=2763505 RepID=UPI0016511DE0|nr:hypothetical protein [Hymenobacter sp. BT190]MBC6696489.1 hypothetical protein [Hymenobacter sp. BT190]
MRRAAGVVSALMQNRIELAQYLLEYEKLVAHCNQIITRFYQLDKPPILAKNARLIPRSATITLNDEVLYYSFHGIGCFCRLGGKSIDFDYCFGTFKYQGFEARKVWDFIESDLNKKRAFKNLASFLNALSELENEGVVARNTMNRINTYEYTLDLEKMASLYSLSQDT